MRAPSGNFWWRAATSALDSEYATTANKNPSEDTVSPTALGEGDRIARGGLGERPGGRHRPAIIQNTPAARLRAGFQQHRCAHWASR
jgi:hypothetical protein